MKTCILGLYLETITISIIREHFDTCTTLMKCLNDFHLLSLKY